MIMILVLVNLISIDLPISIWCKGINGTVLWGLSSSCSLALFDGPDSLELESTSEVSAYLCARFSALSTESN